MSRRAAPGKRWSATSTATAWDTSGGRVGPSSPAAAKVQVRWRLDGKNRKATFTGARCARDAEALSALLRLAYLEDWPADERHRPRRPKALPDSEPEETDGAPGGSASEPPTATLELPAAAAVPTPLDVAALVEWRRKLHRSTPKKRGGAKRSPKTLAGYDSELDFIAAHLVYRPGDPRLEALGVPPGASMRVDDPSTGVAAGDLIALIDLRAATNLRTRAANERKLARWAGAVEREQRRAARQGRDPVLPGPPALRAEEASARTIESMWRELSGLFEQAYLRGRVSYQPCTAEVADQVVRAAPVRFTTRNVPSRSQVAALAAAVRDLQRAGPFRHGRRVVNDGGRYFAMVQTGGREALRPEEQVALRRSWLELDGPRPRIVLHHAEVRETVERGRRELVRVPLKHRGEGGDSSGDPRGRPRAGRDPPRTPREVRAPA